MNEFEIRRLIRKLSRRRHRELKRLLDYMQYPHSRAKECSRTRQEIRRLSEEIDALIARLV